jgi:hypothetical protein
LTHPYFWGAEKRLRFLCDASDREPTIVERDQWLTFRIRFLG